VPLLTDERLFALLDGDVGDVVHAISRAAKIPVIRDGNFVDDRFGDGCGKDVYWNGGGVYGELFTCGHTYPSGATFYCSEECYCRLGSTTRVFISYNWNDRPLVDRMTAAFERTGITFLRDVNEVGAFDSIDSFMSEAGAARFFVTVLSTNYVRSRNCIYELGQVMASDVNIRAVPLIVDPAALAGDDAAIRHWDQRVEAIQQALTELDAHGTESLHDELRVTRDIIARLDQFRGALRSMQIPPLDVLVAEDFRGAVSMILRTVGRTPHPATDRAPIEPDPPCETEHDILVHVSGVALNGPGGALAAEVHSALRDARAFRGTVCDSIDTFLAADPARSFFVCVLHDGYLRSDTVLEAITADERDVTILPLFLDTTMFEPLSEAPWIAHWQNEAAARRGQDRTRAARIRDGIGRFISRQRVRIMPDLHGLRASRFAELIRIMSRAQS
jgi:hypothetical protein